MNGTWACYTMREGQEQEDNMREKTLYLSTQIEKKRRSPLTIESLYSNTTTTTTTSTSSYLYADSSSASSSTSTSSSSYTSTTSYSSPSNNYGNPIRNRDGEQSPKRRRGNSIPSPSFMELNLPEVPPPVEFVSNCAFLGVGKVYFFLCLLLF